MSWLLFMDESGHDHKQMPYEVRGGVAIHASRLWSFVQGAQRLEIDCFGCELAEFRKELKGSTLLDRKRFKFAFQDDPVPNAQRRKLCRGLFAKGLQKKTPTRDELTSYGQACILMAEGFFQLLRDNDAKAFAAAIPRGTAKPATYEAEEYLRKDQVFLLERYFYMLEKRQEHGLMVFDEVDEMEDRRFVARLQRYFVSTSKGRYRSAWIVPTPFFVSSDTSYAVQAADLTIYCLNWGFRLPRQGMDAPVRHEIADRFGSWIGQLQWRGEGYHDGRVFDQFGIVFVSDPYTPR